MKAVVFHEFGPPDRLVVAELPDPEPRAGEVLVRVHAVSVGRTLDIAARAGKLPFAAIETPHVLGAEHAGVVAGVGAGVDAVRPGDRVAVNPVVTCGHCHHCLAGRQEACESMELLGIHRAGAYADYSAVPAENVQLIPDELGFVEASALALSGPVAWQQLTETGVQPGDWVLVQAAASALGSLTAALARHLGARVIATSRQAWKLQRLRAMGFEAVLDWTADDFVARIFELTAGRGVGVAIDDIGSAAMFERTMDALAWHGTMVSSGAFVGDAVPLDLRRLYTRSQRIVGIRTGNPRSIEGLWREVRAGFRPPLDRTFALDDAAAAHAYVEADENFGRVSLANA